MYDRILPAKGLYCAAIARATGYKQEFFDNIDDTLAYLLMMDKKGKTVFLAHSSFKTDENRKQSNVHSVRSFWLDIDCGEDKDYPSQKDGFVALRDFCAEACIPMPIVLSSGNGLYAYWPLTEDVEPARWKTVAQQLRTVLKAYGFRADPARTCDTSSVLRPIGSFNKKDPDNHKEVKLLLDGAAVDLTAFSELLGDAGKSKGVVSTATKSKRKKRGLEGIDLGGMTSIPTSAYKIAEGCAQIKQMKDTKGVIDEPHWYACIGVLHHTTEAPDIIHAWSEGHKAYSEQETDDKIQHFVDSRTGPTTCERFEEINHTKCVGCPHKGAIKSPIVLGRVLPEVVITTIDDEGNEVKEILPTPDNFTRTVDGLFYENEDGILMNFYDHDLYLSDVAYDESLECTVYTVRHFLKHEGWMEFPLRARDMADPKGFHSALMDNAVIIPGKRNKELMMMYVEGYAQRLQRQRKMGKLMSQMGWKGEDEGYSFALGNKLYNHDGTTTEATFGHNVPDCVKALCEKGDRDAWVDTTKFFNHEGTEPFAFAFCAAAFGAPLMKFTGYSGAVVSMLGPSGVGKTLIGRWALSAYGNPDDLVMLKDDTKVAMLARMGVYGNLPLYIDEITNIDPMELSDLVYRLTQGRDRARGTRTGVERKRMNSWNTLAIVSSNSSLIDKLSGAKGNASAEMNRIIEYNVKFHKELDNARGSEVYMATTHNYGHAGREYIQHLVQHTNAHEGRIKALIETLNKHTGAGSGERFWTAVAAVTLYGASIAHELGLITFDLKGLTKWCIKTIKEQQEVSHDAVDDDVALLARFIDEHVGQRLLVRQSQSNMREWTVIESPRGSLSIRVEDDTKNMFISRSVLRKWCSNYNVAYSAMKAALTENGVLVNPATRKVLGGGTSYGGGQQPCWEIDLTHPALGMVAARVVSKSSNKGLTVAQ